MAINRITDDTSIKAGQWVCRKPSRPGEICDPPRKVLDVSNGLAQRIYIEDDGDSLIIRRSSAMFVCDTKEEGDKLYAVSSQQAWTLSLATQAIENEHAAKVAAIIAEAANTQEARDA